MDVSSAKGYADCVKRDRVVRPSTTPKSGAVIDTGRVAATSAIRDARIQAGLTQEKAAALQGVATSTISRWENGGLPQTWKELHEYATALGQPIVLSFGPDTTKEPAPEWARELAEQTAQRVIEILSPGQQKLEDELIRRLEALRQLRAASPPEESAGSDQGGAMPPELSTE